MLTQFEKEVLDEILAGDNPGLQTLKTQLKSAAISSRTVTGSGFFINFSVLPDAPVLPSKESFQITDVIGQVEGIKNGVGFVLFVSDGKLQSLEGFTYDENWPEVVANWKLEYRGGKRNLKDLPNG